MDLRGYSDINLRRRDLEKMLKMKLPHMGNYSLNVGVASARNCENMIGAVQIPLGIAGPLKVKSSSIRQAQDKVQSYYIPLATTEGALIASVNRGSRAIAQSGGASVVSKRVGITRAPVFVVENIEGGEKAIKWVKNNFAEIKKVVEGTSSHLKLLDINSWMVGRNLFLRFKFDSQDAMGMNMATIACTLVADFIEKKTKVKLVSISGNVCVDKKPNMLNFIQGRGTQVWADCTLPLKVVEKILKTTPGKFVDVVTRKIYLGSILSGSIGANSHAANVLAAIFTATGQDIAHIAEVSSVVTTAEIVKKGLYVSVFLSDLVVGTIGGGTGLETQKEALSILGVFGGDSGKNSQRLAEIIGAAVLAGEISLIASLSVNSLARAHQKLGRGEKI
ncbi:MAG: hydroxymethylglutaryl-CoA reductase [Candidatus Levybacteria bacterium]|nr:hydroxymethylglutaryl-CoA reductase [Candidatus Levybacteria bacterium]MDZ4228145.1 hydroxymethylglutaryl-CoA reductase [Candidatus Levybacteria bacterium]